MSLSSQQSLSSTVSNQSPQSPQRVRVKICGLTTAQDAEAAIHAGADALGFNTWPGSKRYLDLYQAAGWIKALPSFVTRVALCVNLPLQEACRIATLPFIDVIQFHGDETMAYCEEFAALGHSFVRAIRLENPTQSASLANWSTRQILLDASVPGAFGGTGARLDLGLAAEAVAACPNLSITLAGGLEPENVAEAVQRVRPYAVDVASGVEASPGRKDAQKMHAFVQAVAVPPVTLT